MKNVIDLPRNSEGNNAGPATRQIPVKSSRASVIGKRTAITPRSDEPNAAEETDVVIQGYQPQVPNSVYIVTFIGHEIGNYRGQHKMVLRFSILEPEEWAGIELRRYYNVTVCNGKPVAAPGSDLAREYRRVCGEGTRLDRLSFRRLKGKRIRARATTVNTSWKGNDLDDYSRYSKIEELLGIKERDGWMEEHESAPEDC